MSKELKIVLWKLYLMGQNNPIKMNPACVNLDCVLCVLSAVLCGGKGAAYNILSVFFSFTGTN